MRRNNSFTLIELLVMIAIGALIVSLLSPSLSKALSTSRGIACQGKLRPLYFAETNFSNDMDGLIYYWGDLSDEKRPWTDDRSEFSSYIAGSSLICPDDPYSEENEERGLDNLSYGRNYILQSQLYYMNDLNSTQNKIMYADSGHILSSPIERESARVGRRASAMNIHGMSSWDDKGIYKRHQERNANILFFDGHVELVFDVFLDVPESYNYTISDDVYKRHWSILD